MKFILLLTFAAVCYAYPRVSTGGRNLNIAEDGTIVISGANGKKITISKAVGADGQKNIDISVNGPDGLTKRIQIDDSGDAKVFDKGGDYDVSGESQRDKRSSRGRKHSSQGDTLTEILGQYQGGVDEAAYEQLLGQVSAAVQSGQLDESFHEVLRNLGQDQSQKWQQYSQQQNQGNLGNQWQRQYNIWNLLRNQGQQRYSQQGAQRYTPYGQQQSYSYGQGGFSPYGQQEGTSFGNTVRRVIEEVGLEQPQVVSYSSGEGFLYGLEGAGGPGVSKIVYIASTGPTSGRTVVEVPEGLVNSYNTKYLKQGDSPLNQYLWQVSQSIPAQLSESIQEEKEILDEQRQLQQQQVGQQQRFQQKPQLYQAQLQKLLQQLQQQQYQPQQQQYQLQQQQYQPQQQQYQPQQQQYQQQQYPQQQQYQQQQYLQQQQQPYASWKEYFLRPSQNRFQQGQAGWQQQQQQGGYYPQGGLKGEYAQQYYNVPLVVY